MVSHPWTMRPGSGPRSLRAIHITLTAILFGVSAILLYPSPTFPTSLAYSMFAKIGSEDQWASFFLLVGCLGLAGIWAEWSPRFTRFRAISAAALSATHGTIALLSLLGSPTGWGWFVWSSIASLGWYFAWEIMYAD